MGSNGVVMAARGRRTVDSDMFAFAAIWAGVKSSFLATIRATFDATVARFTGRRAATSLAPVSPPLRHPLTSDSCRSQSNGSSGDSHDRIAPEDKGGVAVCR
jgi:hypothetical protein